MEIQDEDIKGKLKIMLIMRDSTMKEGKLPEEVVDSDNRMLKDVMDYPITSVIKEEIDIPEENSSGDEFLNCGEVGETDNNEDLIMTCTDESQSYDNLPIEDDNDEDIVKVSPLDIKEETVEVISNGNTSSNQELVLEPHSLMCRNLGISVNSSFVSVELQCITCDAVLYSYKQLDMHLGGHFGAQPYKCKVCFKTFTLSSQIITHTKSYIEKFYCNLCSKSFSNSHMLRRHMTVHSDKRPFTCDICGTSVKSLSTLKVHLLIHSDIKRFMCKFCDKKYIRYDRLKIHLRKHTNEKPFVCFLCKKSFRCGTSLRSHVLRLHGVDREYFHCNICNEKFIYNSELKIHLSVHNNRESFKCKFCDKSFPSNAEVRRHLKVHSDERPFSCEICKKSYKHRDSLKHHKLTHNGNKPYSCEVCKKSFSRPDHLRFHMTQRHSKEILPHL